MTSSRSSKIISSLKHFGVMLWQWWDSDHVPVAQRGIKLPDRVDFKRVMPFIILHAGCFLVYFVGFSWFALGAAIALYFIRMFAITAFYHRYFSHRSFKTSRFMQFVFAVWGNTAMQRGPLWWASHHRHHHAHSDDEHDVHSPVQRGFLWSHIGWITSMQNYFTDYTRVKDLAKHKELVFINRHDMVVPVLYGIALALTGWGVNHFFPSLGTSAGQLFVWGFFISTVALAHGTFCINSLSHVFGGRRFETTDTSRNSLLLSLATLGEGWHNNHHRYQFSTRQGFYWWEIDISFYVLRMMSWLGLVWDLKPVPAQIYEEARQTAAAKQS